MRILKLALISFICFFLLLTLISLLVPSQIRISKAINIAPKRNAIMSLITDTSRWKEWHPMFKTSAQNSVEPVSANDSVIIKKTTGKSGRTVTNGWQVYNYAHSDSLTVQWYMDIHLQWYPWQKFGSLFYEATYGNMMQQGLIDLKTAAEAKENEAQEP